MPAGSRRRSVTGAGGRNNKLTYEQIAEIERNLSDDYRAHKKAMHKAGARAAPSDDPGAIRHLRRSSLADVLTMESRARAGETAAI